MKKISVSGSNVSILAIALKVDGVNVQKHDWLGAIYSNLREIEGEREDMRHFNGAERLAKLLGWGDDDEKAALLSTDWSISYLRDDQNTPDLNKIINETENLAPCKDIKPQHIMEIIIKLSKRYPEWAENAVV